MEGNFIIEIYIMSITIYDIHKEMYYITHVILCIIYNVYDVIYINIISICTQCMYGERQRLKYIKIKNKSLNKHT